MKKLIIFGTSNNAKLASFYFLRDNKLETSAFCVDKEYFKEPEFYHKQVITFDDLVNYPPSDYDAFVAIGYSRMNQTREEMYHKVKKMGYKLINYVSPRCSFLSEEPIGDNNFILEDNTIQPFVKIGSNNVLWSGNHIGHDVLIHDHCFITSHVVISGFTEIRSNSFLGVNSTLRDSIVISEKTLVGAGAIINESTNIGDVMLPARSTKYHKNSSEIKI